MIRVMIFLDLPDYWGADECWADSNNGPSAIRDLVMEDMGAFLEEAHWKVDKVEIEGQ